MNRKNTVEDFWKKVNKNGPIPKHIPELGKCWIWTKSTTQDGYGCFYFEGKQYRANRFSWELHNNKKIPKNLECCHLCDNPSCVNPEHLVIRTHKWNMEDASRKGKMDCSKKTKLKISKTLKDRANGITIKQVKIRIDVSGENNPYSKLSNFERFEIYNLYHSQPDKFVNNSHKEVSINKIAKMYNVSYGCVYRVVHNDKWKNYQSRV